VYILVRKSILVHGIFSNVPPEHWKGALDGRLSQGRTVLFVPPRNPVGFLTLFSARRKHCARRVSPSADGDKGYSPLTSTAFSEEKAAQKTFLFEYIFTNVTNYM
jgi:hypothetical protein